MDEALQRLLSDYGYVALAGVGFAEYVGMPVAGVPLLVIAGGLGASAGLAPVPILLSAAAGGLAADLLWFCLIRWRGDALVDAACGLTPNRDACVLGVREKVSRFGSLYVVPAKFIPGAGNLLAAGAAMAGMDPRRFALLDGAALLLWAAVWTSLGRLFTAQLEQVLSLIERYQAWALALAGALVLAGALWRGARVLRHREHHV